MEAETNAGANGGDDWWRYVNKSRSMPLSAIGPRGVVLDCPMKLER